MARVFKLPRRELGALLSVATEGDDTVEYEGRSVSADDAGVGVPRSDESRAERPLIDSE